MWFWLVLFLSNEDEMEQGGTGSGAMRPNCMRTWCVGATLWDAASGLSWHKTDKHMEHQHIMFSYCLCAPVVMSLLSFIFSCVFIICFIIQVFFTTSMEINAIHLILYSSQCKDALYSKFKYTHTNTENIQIYHLQSAKLSKERTHPRPQRFVLKCLPGHEGV